jgi:hypothetical protein
VFGGLPAQVCSGWVSVRPEYARRLGQVVAWSSALVLAAGTIRQVTYTHSFGSDAYAYWLTAHEHQIYSAPPRAFGAFLYSPAFAQAIYPLATLPWTIFCGVWVLLEAIAFWWLLKPLGARWAVPALVACSTELALGNVYAFLAVAAVVGMTRPALWTLPLLSKVTPGVGVLWFAVRREWRMLGLALGATGAITAVSVTLAPQQWAHWIAFLIDHRSGGGVSLVLRLTAAAALVVLGARTNRRWIVAPAMLLSTPVIAGLSAVTLLAAIPRLVAMQAGTELDPLAVPRSPEVADQYGEGGRLRLGRSFPI